MPEIVEYILADYSKIRHIDINEFCETGFLQEANRLFFNPLGLALEVTIDEDGTKISGVWDYRDDPEGVAFHSLAGEDALRKAANVRNELEKHRAARTALFGSIIQEIQP